MNKLIVLALLFTIGLVACKPKPQAIAINSPDKAYYTCSMHPQVHLDHDGNCPVCGMKLIRVELTGASNKTNDRITLTATQIQLGGILTDSVTKQNIGSEKMLTGTVSVNESKSEELSAKIPGRIQHLFVRTVGEKITTGQPVYAVYSEDLQEAEKEYLLAIQQEKQLQNTDVDYKQLLSAAENKLRLWGLSASQIKALALSGKVSATVNVLSNNNGTVSDILVHEGDYLAVGAPILKTQVLDHLWVQAQVYANEAANIKENNAVNVFFPDLGWKLIKGKIEFTNPELSGSSRVNLVRVSISNDNGLIRPGMQAYLSSTSANVKTLAIPVSALITSGNGEIVWVKNADGSFSMRHVVTGAGNRYYRSVISGLAAGEVIVTNGAYLLNSEFLFKNGDESNKTKMSTLKS